jgi:hypothetical protein
MRFLRDRYAMGGLLVGGIVVLLLLFLQNAGMASLSNPFVAAVWWLLAWPFTFAALTVAGIATGSQISPAWGMPLLLLSILLNALYLYLLGKLVGFIKSRATKAS